MKENRFQRVLREGRMPTGHMLMEFGTRGIAKILAAADLDYVVVDMEHTGYDAERIADLMAWFKATDIAPFVRVPQSLYHFISRTMDAGALGVMIGNVETPEQAKSVVDAAKYAPLGKRGVGLGTAHNDYVVPDAEAYFEYANRNSTVICQIESVTGLANLDAIASTPGVDVLWVGHFDLSQSMGLSGKFDHPRFREALESVVDAANRHGKLAAAQPGSLQQAEDWFRTGFHVLSWKTDIALYRAALQRELQEFRKLASVQQTGSRGETASS
jgi:2-dehydro-3-deoxyglucarate aldolase/4-hydroxy-2-oxoheptanedioate aldolase